MTTPSAITVAIVFAAYVTGCGNGQGPVAQVAADIRGVTPLGWSVATSNSAIRIQSERDVSLIDRISRPPLRMEQLAREIGRNHEVSSDAFFRSTLDHR